MQRACMSPAAIEYSFLRRQIPRNKTLCVEVKLIMFAIETLQLRAGNHARIIQTST